jgi:hypothetical protein
MLDSQESNVDFAYPESGSGRYTTYIAALATYFYVLQILLGNLPSHDEVATMFH